MPSKSYRSPYIIFSVIAVLITAVIVYYSAHFNLHALIIYLLAINVTTIIFYAYDKLISGGSLLRIPENVLHGLAILGGSPGALLSQKIFRHKTVKKSFQLVYWIIVVIQVVLLIWYLLP